LPKTHISWSFAEWSIEDLFRGLLRDNNVIFLEVLYMLLGEIEYRKI
jgi:hypothetical protein